MLSFRIDYRFTEQISCCSDDFDYYSHAATIVFDGDFDYSNQIKETHPYFYKYNNKIAPIGFPGSGILFSPFLFIGNLIDNNLSNSEENFLNYGLLLYSIAPIVYFFIGYFYLLLSLRKLNYNPNKYEILIFLFGSGLPYFAFERFSMTHVFEFFLISLLIYNLINYHLCNNKLSSAIIPILITLILLTRMSNYFVLLLPIIIKKLIRKNNYEVHNLLKNKFFLISSFLSFYIYFKLTNLIYGRLIFNPQKVYGTDIDVNNIINSNTTFIEYIIQNFFNLFKILFSNEFGIFWVSPILFIGFFITLLGIKSKNYFLYLLTFLCFMQNFAIVLIWKSTASSYGFRYLYSLVPLSILIFYDYMNNKNNLFKNYLMIFSIFSCISLLFFETTVQTQLSTEEIYNTFGEIKRYSAPTYVTGVFKSVFTLNSYLIIFTTSWLGVVFFKILLGFLDSANLIHILSQLGLPSKDTDFIYYLDEIMKLSWTKIYLVCLILLFFSYLIVNNKYQNFD